ncbi:ZIP family metal transporter [Halorubellus sp. JP-L1]|uniref:ZIP family metal transporter n=1 Tax=Halorubellus sp. JP-L1 TaxID=2715753 RepID=UPI001408D256|nr:ZIP family metal transporter [Halorubellus sp. JP-L1]NHN41695.1 ZIP family metal transporter [Halorubellus sp. JP-L1]
MSAATDLFVNLVGDSVLVQALVGGIVIAFMNLFGASLILFIRDPSERFLDGALGFAAGVMLAAAFTSLILPGIDAAGGDPLPVLFGVLLGAAFLDQADRFVPHAHYLLTGKKREDAAQPSGDVPAVDDAKVASVVLFILAITLHNMPEGLAVGVGFGNAANATGADATAALADALSLMLAIGIQNVPEGLAVSVAAVNAGLDRRTYAIFAGVRSGVVEIPLCVFGALAVTLAAPLLPYAMGFAAGAMLFVISDEIVPETHSRGYERVATTGLMIGVVVMLYLDVSLA